MGGVEIVISSALVGLMAASRRMHSAPGRHSSFADNLDQYPLPALAVEFPVEDLLPWTEI
jgi:hypothetical protein